MAHLSPSKSVGGMERSDASELRMYNSSNLSFAQVMYHSVSGNQPLIDAHCCIHSIGGFECWEPLLRGFSALQTIIPIDLTSQVCIYKYKIDTELNCSQESKRVLKKKMWVSTCNSLKSVRRQVSSSKDFVSSRKASADLNYLNWN